MNSKPVCKTQEDRRILSWYLDPRNPWVTIIDARKRFRDHFSGKTVSPYILKRRVAEKRSTPDLVQCFGQALWSNIVFLAGMVENLSVQCPSFRVFKLDLWAFHLRLCHTEVVSWSIDRLKPHYELLWCRVRGYLWLLLYLISIQRPNFNFGVQWS